MRGGGGGQSCHTYQVFRRISRARPTASPFIFLLAAVVWYTLGEIHDSPFPPETRVWRTERGSFVQKSRSSVVVRYSAASCVSFILKLCDPVDIVVRACVCAWPSGASSRVVMWATVTRRVEMSGKKMVGRERTRQMARVDTRYQISGARCQVPGARC